MAKTKQSIAKLMILLLPRISVAVIDTGLTDRKSTFVCCLKEEKNEYNASKRKFCVYVYMSVNATASVFVLNSHGCMYVCSVYM